MPLYEYKCDSCGRQCDAFRRVSNMEPQVCQCGENMRKLISRFAGGQLKKQKTDVKREIQRRYGLKRGERIYESAWAGKSIRLPDNKRAAEDAAFRLEQSANPELKRKDFKLHQ